MSKIYVDYATNTNEEFKKKDWINVKIDLLYDLAILKKRKRTPDCREPQITELLEQCETRYEMDTLLHDVICGNMTLNELLIRGMKRRYEK
jgi:hypothetical protein